MTLSMNITPHHAPVYSHRVNGLIFLFRFAVTHRATCGQWVQAIGHLLSREGVPDA
jgi:hypothetical protein